MIQFNERTNKTLMEVSDRVNRVDNAVQTLMEKFGEAKDRKWEEFFLYFHHFVEDYSEAADKIEKARQAAERKARRGQKN